MLGSSNMVSVITPSMMARRPRAPLLRVRACWAMARSASGVNSSSTSSKLSSLAYWRTRAFFGSVRIFTRASSSRLFRVTSTGSLPMNSGIRPNLSRSSGRTWDMISTLVWSFLLFTSAPKPITFLPMRLSTIFSMPSNAPPQMNRMLLVSIWMNSCRGCLRPPCGGTEAMVPSRIFKSACCTPSPDTSRVMEGFSLLRAILSISSM